MTVHENNGERLVSEAIREVMFDRGIGFQPVVFFANSQAGSLRHGTFRTASQSILGTGVTVPSIEGNSHDGLSGRTPWIAGFVRWAWIVLPIVLLVAVAIHVWGSRLRAHALLAELQRRDMSYSFVPDDWFPAMWPNRLRSLDYAFGYKLNGIGYSWSPEPPALGSLKSLLDPLDPSVNFSFNGAIGKRITQALSDELIDDLNSVGFCSVSFFRAELDDDDLLQLARLGSLKNLTLQQCQIDATALKRFRLSRPDVRVDETN